MYMDHIRINMSLSNVITGLNNNTDLEQITFFFQLGRFSTENLSTITYCVRKVINMWTGWAFIHPNARPVNYFAHPVNSTYPFPKIAYPVNYFIHRNTGIPISENEQIRPKVLPNFQNQRWNFWDALKLGSICKKKKKKKPMKLVSCLSWFFH